MFNFKSVLVFEDIVLLGWLSLHQSLCKFRLDCIEEPGLDI